MPIREGNDMVGLGRLALDVISNPIQFLKDTWAFINWCEDIDSEINRKIN